MNPPFKIILACLTITLVLAGCSANHNLLKCPELTSAKHHKILLAKNSSRQHSVKSGAGQQSAKNTDSSAQDKDASGFLAAAGNAPVNIKLPPLLARNISNDEEVQAMNQFIGAYSNNRVDIQRKDNGKLYLQAKSGKDLVSLTKNLVRPRGYYERRYGNGGGGGNNGIAIAAGILGLIAFIFAWIPFLNLLAPLLGIIAIILGAIGLNSHRKGHAIAGIVFGILAIFIALLTISLFLAGLGFIFI